MEEKTLLKEIGLSNYEIAAYLKLAEMGITDARTLYKEANIPFGRIYEVLNSLVGKGLVEVQGTRPKKYRVKKSKIAFGNLLKRKKEEMEEQFQKTVEIVSQIEDNILKRMPSEPKEKAFWTVAVGNREIAEMMKYNFEEAEKELCVMTRGRVNDRIKHLPIQPEILGSLFGAIRRGVKLRVLVGDGFALPEGIIQKAKLKLLLSKIEIRAAKDINSYFEICDDNIVMLKVDNPANLAEILAAIRIYDIKLAKELKGKFEELWARAKPV
ncbi:Putative HTH-type transcriptional regulator TrmBL2 [uncultured archaeon]|nr:Putative HTH-type transcriptional regulator TrmBL2 [uncultured archaeon]